MVPKFLQEVLEACESIQMDALPVDLFKQEVAMDETVLGTMDESLIRLFAVRQGMRKEKEETGKKLALSCVKHLSDSESENEDREHKKAHEEFERLAQRSKAVDELFWTSLREEFLGAEGIGVRKGGRVVSVPEGPDAIIQDLLSALEEAST